MQSRRFSKERARNMALRAKYIFGAIGKVAVPNSYFVIQA